MRVDWTGDTSAFVTLHRKENSHFVLRETVLPAGCTIVSYESHLKNLRLGENKEANAASRKRVGSAIPSADVSLLKKVRQDPLEKDKMTSKTEFEVSEDWA